MLVVLVYTAVFGMDLRRWTGHVVMIASKIESCTCFARPYTATVYSFSFRTKGVSPQGNAVSSARRRMRGLGQAQTKHVAEADRDVSQPALPQVIYRHGYFSVGFPDGNNEQLLKLKLHHEANAGYCCQTKQSFFPHRKRTLVFDMHVQLYAASLSG